MIDGRQRQGRRGRSRPGRTGHRSPRPRDARDGRHHRSPAPAESAGLKVIVVSTLTQRNAAISSRCLSLGALDYLGKPGRSSAGHGLSHLQERTAQRLRRLPAHAQTRAAVPQDCHAAPRPGIRPVAQASMPADRSLDRRTQAVEEVLVGLGSALQRAGSFSWCRPCSPASSPTICAQVGVRACRPEDGEPLVAGTMYRRAGVLRWGCRSASAIRSSGSTTRPPVNLPARGRRPLPRCRGDLRTGGPCGRPHGHVAPTARRAQGRSRRPAPPFSRRTKRPARSWGMPGSIAKAGLAQDVLLSKPSAPP